MAEAVEVVDFCRNQARSTAEMFETVETREAMNGLGCKLLGAWAESRDDGASRIERDGQSWFRVAATPKTIMTTLGPVVFRRARYRRFRTSLVPVAWASSTTTDPAGGRADDDGPLYAA